MQVYISVLKYRPYEQKVDFARKSFIDTPVATDLSRKTVSDSSTPKRLAPFAYSRVLEDYKRMSRVTIGVIPLHCSMTMSAEHRSEFETLHRY